MQFERDVFISYAHIDNQPLPGGGQGWVTVFHEALRLFLTRFMGEDAEIWRDPKLAGNDVFSDEIGDQLPKTAALVSIGGHGFANGTAPLKHTAHVNSEFSTLAVVGLSCHAG